MLVKIKLIKDVLGQKAGTILDVISDEADMLIKSGSAEIVKSSHSWVKLKGALLGHNPGDIVKLDSEITKKTYIEKGLAEDCESPESDVVTKAIESAAGKLVEAATKAVDSRLEQFANGVEKRFKPIPAEPKDHEAEGMAHFKHAGEFWHAVVKAGKPGCGVDSRLLTKAPAGLNEQTGSEGGFLVPPTISQRIMELVFDDAGLLARTDTESIAGSSLTVNANDETSRATGSRRGGIRGYWMEEAANHTATKPSFRQLTLRPHKLGVFYYATDEEIEDTTGYSLEQKLGQYAADEINWLISDGIINGDGIGKPVGILNAGCLVTVDKETSQTADTVNFPNLAKMYARMLPRSLPNAIWLIGIEVMAQLLQLTVNASATVPIWLPGSQYPTATDAPFGTLLGRPVMPIEQCSKVGDLGDVIFADLSMYKTATKGAIRNNMSIHVNFLSGETAFRFDFRMDGQPWMRSAVTPANGGGSLSPFVTLQAR